MRDDYDTSFGKFDRPITRFVYDRVIMNGGEDEFVSDGDGESVSRVGRRLVFEDNRGFVAMDKYTTEGEAMEVFTTVSAHFDQLYGATVEVVIPEARASLRRLWD